MPVSGCAGRADELASRGRARRTGGRVTQPALIMSEDASYPFMTMTARTLSAVIQPR